MEMSLEITKMCSSDTNTEVVCVCEWEKERDKTKIRVYLPSKEQTDFHCNTPNVCIAYAIIACLIYIFIWL